MGEDQVDDEQEESRSRKEEFPLEAYTAVYDWIAKWAEEECDSEARVIAQAAFESLTAVGVLMHDVMRQMRIEIEALPAS